METGFRTILELKMFISSVIAYLWIAGNLPAFSGIRGWGARDPMSGGFKQHGGNIKKACFLTRSLSKRGVERQLAVPAGALQARGHSICVLTRDVCR